MVVRSSTYHRVSNLRHGVYTRRACAATSRICKCLGYHISRKIFQNTNIMSTHGTMYILLKPDIDTVCVKPVLTVINESRRLIIFNYILANCADFSGIIG